MSERASVAFEVQTCVLCCVCRCGAGSGVVSVIVVNVARGGSNAGCVCHERGGANCRWLLLPVSTVVRVVSVSGCVVCVCVGHVRHASCAMWWCSAGAVLLMLCVLSVLGVWYRQHAINQCRRMCVVSCAAELHAINQLWIPYNDERSLCCCCHAVLLPLECRCQSLHPGPPPPPSVLTIVLQQPSLLLHPAGASCLTPHSRSLTDSPTRSLCTAMHCTPHSLPAAAAAVLVHAMDDAA